MFDLTTTNELTMSAKKAIEIGFPVKQSKRFLRNKRILLITLSDYANNPIFNKVRRIISDTRFEVDFKFIGGTYILIADGIRYVDFDIFINKRTKIGLIDHRDLLSKILSMPKHSEREKISFIHKLERICSYIGDYEALDVCYAVLHSLMMDLRERRSEKSLFSKFIENNEFQLNFIEPSKRSGSHQADAWVLIDGEECPVEAKKGDFNSSALKQLLRYMKVFGSKKGVAVASRLKTPLPENVVFYNIGAQHE